MKRRKKLTRDQKIYLERKGIKRKDISNYSFYGTVNKKDIYCLNDKVLIVYDEDLKAFKQVNKNGLSKERKDNVAENEEQARIAENKAIFNEKKESITNSLCLRLNSVCNEMGSSCKKLFSKGMQLKYEVKYIALNARQNIIFTVDLNNMEVNLKVTNPELRITVFTASKQLCSDVELPKAISDACYALYYESCSTVV